MFNYVRCVLRETGSTTEKEGRAGRQHTTKIMKGMPAAPSKHTEHMSLTQPAIQASPAHFVTSQPDGFTGVELVSRATFRTEGTGRRDGVKAKRKLMAKLEISHEAAKLILRCVPFFTRGMYDWTHKISVQTDHVFDCLYKCPTIPHMVRVIPPKFPTQIDHIFSTLHMNF